MTGPDPRTIAAALRAAHPTADLDTLERWGAIASRYGQVSRDEYRRRRPLEITDVGRAILAAHN